MADKFIPVDRLEHLGDSELVEVREFSALLDPDELEDKNKLAGFSRAEIPAGYNFLLISSKNPTGFSQLIKKSKAKGFGLTLLAQYQLKDYNRLTFSGWLRLYTLKKCRI